MGGVLPPWPGLGCRPEEVSFAPIADRHISSSLWISKCRGDFTTSGLLTPHPPRSHHWSISCGVGEEGTGAVPTAWGPRRGAGRALPPAGHHGAEARAARCSAVPGGAMGRGARPGRPGKLSAPGRLGAAWGWGRGDFPVSRGGFAGGRVGGGRSCSGSSSSSASFPAAVNCLVPAVQRCSCSSRPTEAVASSLEGLGGAVSSQPRGASRLRGAAVGQG